MTGNSENNEELNLSISQSFELRKTEGLSIDEFRKILANEIRLLLDKNVEKLLTILYRIDVSQKKTEEIFGNDSKDKIAELLADSIIERQLLKLQTRKEYKNKS